jgi:hypothetical protein
VSSQQQGGTSDAYGNRLICISSFNKRRKVGLCSLQYRRGGIT